MRRQWLLTVLVATAFLGDAPASLGAQEQLFRINADGKERTGRRDPSAKTAGPHFAVELSIRRC